MSLITVDSAKCKHDGLCAMVCPMGIITQKKNEIPVAVPNAEKMCVGCGHCIAVCPFEALSIAGISPDSLTTIKKDLAVKKEAMLQLVKAHRSVREYQNKPVPHEILAEIVDATRWAPTAANLQPVHWLVIEDSKEVKRLATILAEGARHINFNPDMLAAWDQGYDVFLRNAPHLIIAHAHATKNFMPTTDCTIALTCLDMLAYTYGIGTCWAGVLMIIAKQYPPLAEALRLPEGHEVYGAMMLGYSKYSYHKIPQRKPAKISWR